MLTILETRTKNTARLVTCPCCDGRRNMGLDLDDCPLCDGHGLVTQGVREEFWSHGLAYIVESLTSKKHCAEKR